MNNELHQFWPHMKHNKERVEAFSPDPLTSYTTRPFDPNVAEKFDEGKRDWSLLPYDSVEEIVKVLEFGAKKYSRDNWKHGEGFKYTRTFNAIMRHMVAVMFRKEDNDPETGLSHWAHVGANILFILHFVLNKEKYNKCDDR